MGGLKPCPISPPRVALLPTNPQVIFYDVHISHYNDSSLNRLWSQHIQEYILKPGDYVDDQPNSNGQILKLKNLYANARMNWVMKHGTIKFTTAHMNNAIFETWEAKKLPYASITHYYFKK